MVANKRSGKKIKIAKELSMVWAMEFYDKLKRNIIVKKNEQH